MTREEVNRRTIAVVQAHDEVEIDIFHQKRLVGRVCPFTSPWDGIMALGSGDDKTDCSNSSLENGWKTDVAALY
jgi:hypothetical protein